MLRDLHGSRLTACAGAAILTLAVCALSCIGQSLELIAPSASETLQYRTNAFVAFFAPEIGEAGLVGLRLSITNTTGNTLAIDWENSYFDLPSGERSDAVASDIPDSFQRLPTQISIRQTAEIVAIPLGHVSYSESGWSIGVIEAEADAQFTLHLTIEIAEDETAESYDFAFRVVDADPPVVAPSPRILSWALLVTLGAGFLLGFLLGRS